MTSIKSSFPSPDKSVALVLLLLMVNSAFFLTLGWKPGFAYNAQRYFEILLLTNIALLAPFLAWRLALSRLMTGLLLTALLLALGAVLSAADAWLAWREFLQFGALFAVVVVVAKARQQADKTVFDAAALLGLFILATGMLLITLQGLSFALMIRLVDWAIIFDAFINVRIFAELQYVLLLMMPAVWLRSAKKGWRLAVTLVAAGLWGLLLFSGSRASLLVFPTALLMVVLLARGRSLPWLRVLFIQFGLGVLFYLALRFAVDAYMGAASGTGQAAMNLMRGGSSGRIDLWQQAWQLFLAHPWLGAGPGMFACVTTRMEATPHNIMMLLLSEWGLLFTLLVITIAVLALLRMGRVLHSASSCSFLQLSLFAAVVAIMAGSMTAGMILAPLNQLLEVLVVGWALHEFAARPMQAWQGAAWLKARSVYLLLFVVGFIAVVAMTKVDLAKQDTLFTLPDGSINLSYGPRYWADGHDYCPVWQQRFRSRWQDVNNNE